MGGCSIGLHFTVLTRGILCGLTEFVSPTLAEGRQITVSVAEIPVARGMVQRWKPLGFTTGGTSA